MTSTLKPRWPHHNRIILANTEDGPRRSSTEPCLRALRSRRASIHGPSTHRRFSGGSDRVHESRVRPPEENRNVNSSLGSPTRKRARHQLPQVVEIHLELNDCRSPGHGDRAVTASGARIRAEACLFGSISTHVKRTWPTSSLSNSATSERIGSPEGSSSISSTRRAITAPSSSPNALR